MTTSTKKTVVSVLPFGIEADHPRNSDLMIQAIQQRLRSAIKATKEVFDREDGEQTTRPASARNIDGIPGNIPGMQLHVDPGECTYKVVDPLQGDEETLEKIQRAMQRNSGVRVARTLKGVKPVEGVLGPDEMKTLVREVLNLINSGEARRVRGDEFDMDDVNDLPGDFLLNPSNVGNYHQPRYEKDLREWKENLNRVG